MKKFLFDLFPLILFFLAFKFSDIFTATAVAIAAGIGQIIWLKARGKAIEAMHWINLTIIVVFGGATLLLHDDTFIKWKPTVLYWLFAGILLGGKLLFGRNLIQKVMGTQIALPGPVWNKLNLSWALFFIVSGALNLYVAFSGRFTEAQWVNFKVFGLMALMLAFVIAQSIWLGRYMKEDPQPLPKPGKPEQP
ncbi:MAG TPA: septation protein A [Eoetvoesiella sp.]|jgi:intracellular septation protein|uniref:septation protein A n=1 Tax=Eoetvoesiella sp. TaxID=1966355 RepID=UPI002CCB49DE|nr:septation protein A [Eoetvoesiella sp.]HWK61191.1 septation protein A [Eoetvoesiella sp.]